MVSEFGILDRYRKEMGEKGTYYWHGEEFLTDEVLKYGEQKIGELELLIGYYKARNEVLETQKKRMLRHIDFLMNEQYDSPSAFLKKHLGKDVFYKK